MTVTKKKSNRASRLSLGEGLGAPDHCSSALREGYRFSGERGFSTWIYQNWRDAYDLKAIAQSVDFLCLMTYDQHTLWTVPGPVAGWTWTVVNLD